MYAKKNIFDIWWNQANVFSAFLKFSLRIWQITNVCGIISKWNASISVFSDIKEINDVNKSVFFRDSSSHVPFLGLMHCFCENSRKTFYSAWNWSSCSSQNYSLPHFSSIFSHDQLHDFQRDRPEIDPSFNRNC